MATAVSDVLAHLFHLFLCLKADHSLLNLQVKRARRLSIKKNVITIDMFYSSDELLATLFIS